MVVITLRFGPFTTAREARELKVLMHLIRLSGSAKMIHLMAISHISIPLLVKKEKLCSKTRILEGT